MKKLPPLLASLILPGVGHVLRGRIAVGLAFFVAVVVLLDLLAYVAFGSAPAAPRWRATVLLGGLAALWLACQAHLAYLLYGADPNRDAERKEAAFHEGLRHYLRNELADAIHQFERVLRMDRFDYDAHFYLGVCHSRAGAHKRAIRCFKKCIEFDDDRKWAEEVTQELARAQAGRKAMAKTTAP